MGVIVAIILIAIAGSFIISIIGALLPVILGGGAIIFLLYLFFNFTTFRVVVFGIVGIVLLITILHSVYEYLKEQCKINVDRELKTAKDMMIKELRAVMNVNNMQALPGKRVIEEAITDNSNIPENIYKNNFYIRFKYSKDKFIEYVLDDVRKKITGLAEEKAVKCLESMGIATMEEFISEKGYLFYEYLRVGGEPEEHSKEYKICADFFKNAFANSKIEKLRLNDGIVIYDTGKQGSNAEIRIIEM